MGEPKRYHIRLLLEPNPGGVFTVSSPDVPGLITEGSTQEEILANVQDALATLMEGWEKLGRAIPPAPDPIEAGPHAYDATTCSGCHKPALPLLDLNPQESLIKPHPSHKCLNVITWRPVRVRRRIWVGIAQCDDRTDRLPIRHL